MQAKKCFALLPVQPAQLPQLKMGVLPRLFLIEPRLRPASIATVSLLMAALLYGKLIGLLAFNRTK